MRVYRCSGLALTEVLIAAALLAIGLLGQLALLVTGLRTERAAENLSTAATLAADLGERLRANPSAATLYALDPDESPPDADCGVAMSFDAATRAACDLDEWRREATAALPGMSGRVVVTAVAGAATTYCVITIRWPTVGQPDGEYTLRLQV